MRKFSDDWYGQFSMICCKVIDINSLLLSDWFVAHPYFIFTLKHYILIICHLYSHVYRKMTNTFHKIKQFWFVTRYTCIPDYIETQTWNLALRHHWCQLHFFNYLHFPICILLFSSSIFYLFLTVYFIYFGNFYHKSLPSATSLLLFLVQCWP